jgi:hypothetical protein
MWASSVNFAKKTARCKQSPIGPKFAQSGHPDPMKWWYYVKGTNANMPNANMPNVTVPNLDKTSQSQNVTIPMLKVPKRHYVYRYYKVPKHHYTDVIKCRNVTIPML